MALPHEHDGSHDAIENFLKEGIMLVTQYVKHHKAQRLAETTEATRRDHELKISGRQERFQQNLAAKLGLERAQASIRYSQVGNDEWWQQADAPTILDTYKHAAGNAEQDPKAAQAVEVMTDYMKTHMGIDVAAISKAAAATDTSDEVGKGDDVHEAYEDHLESGRSLTASDQPAASRDSSVDREIAGLEQRFASNANVDDLTAGIRDLHLSQALTAVASPHTIDQVADAADADADLPQARRTTPELAIDQGRENLDR